MTSTAVSTSLLYISSDVPDGQTLSDWRRARAAARRAERPARRSRRLLPTRWTS